LRGTDQTARGSVLDKHPCCLSELTSTRLHGGSRSRNYDTRGSSAFCHRWRHKPSGPASERSRGARNDVHNLLHVRSFLDHNRPYSPPANYVKRTGPGLPVARLLTLGTTSHPTNWKKLGSTSSPLGPYVAGSPAHPRASYFATGTYCCQFDRTPAWHMTEARVLGPVPSRTACILEMRS